MCARRLGMTLAAAVVMMVTRPMPAGAADIAGKWIGVTEVPDQGTDVVTMIIVRTEGGFAVTLSDSLGVVAADAGVRDVKLENDVLTFHFTITDGAVLTMRLAVAGEKMLGQWEHPEGNTGAIVFERKS